MSETSEPKSVVQTDAGPSFNWHEESRDSFLGWLVVTVLSKQNQDRAEFQRVAKATGDFTDVRITMQINGIPVDALAFIDGVHRNMDYAVGVEAQRIVREETGFAAVAQIVDDAERAVKRALLDQLAAAGIELKEEDSW